LSPENIVYLPQRILGKRFDDLTVQQDSKHLMYKIVKGVYGDAAVEISGKSKESKKITC
jgi:hypothetical protein